MLIVGDFNLEQMLLEHVAKVNPLIQNFNLSQRSQYSTHIRGGTNFCASTSFTFLNQLDYNENIKDHSLSGVDTSCFQNWCKINLK